MGRGHHSGGNLTPRARPSARCTARPGGSPLMIFTAAQDVVRPVVHPGNLRATEGALPGAWRTRGVRRLARLGVNTSPTAWDCEGVARLTCAPPVRTRPHPGPLPEGEGGRAPLVGEAPRIPRLHATSAFGAATLAGDGGAVPGSGTPSPLPSPGGRGRISLHILNHSGAPGPHPLSRRVECPTLFSPPPLSPEGAADRSPRREPWGRAGARVAPPTFLLLSPGARLSQFRGVMRLG
jgi:hypothetical protein